MLAVSEGMKRCAKCGRVLPLSAFNKQKRKKSGYQSYCRECAAKEKQKWTQQNLEAVREYSRQRRQDPEKRAIDNETRRRWVAACREGNHAHNAILRALKKHGLVRANTCQLCGKECKPDGHHYSYSRRTDVIWLCKSCHKQYHDGITARASAVKEAVDAIARLRCLEAEEDSDDRA